MFCVSLRRRPLWRTVGPILAATGSLKLREAKLGTHDFELPLGIGECGAQRHLHVLLVTSLSVEDRETVARLEQFTALTGGSDLAIALLLSEEKPIGTNSDETNVMPLILLQKLILEHLPVYIPIIPIQSPEFLLSALQSYIKNISHAPQEKALSTSTDLISHCTVTAPYHCLDQHSVNILSDLFPTIRDLCWSARTDTGMEVLKEYIDPPTINDILSFWRGPSDDVLGQRN